MKTRWSIAIVLCLAMALLGCDNTPAPVTPTPTVCIGGGDCGTPAVPPTATVTSTPTATHTATPYPTCPVCPTCVPTQTQIPMGSLYVRCFVDVDDSGDYTGEDTGLPCALRFGQDIGMDAPRYTVLTLTTGFGGVALWGGIYTVEVQWHDGGIPVTASAVYCPAFVFVNPGANVVFNCAFNAYAPAPKATRTPTPWDPCPSCPDRTPTATRAVPSATPNAATKTRSAGG